MYAFDKSTPKRLHETVPEESRGLLKKLTVRIGREETLEDARVGLAFPIQHPGKYIDICNSKDESQGMLKSPRGLDQGTRIAIEAALEVRYLIPDITSIPDIKEHSAFVLRWTVETSRGQRSFFTESSREAVRYQGPNRIRITDLTDNHYNLPDITALDAASRAILSNYL